MDPELIKLIEDNGLTLHGDIEFFAHLVAEREREACIAVCAAIAGQYDWLTAFRCVDTIRARGGDA